MPAEDSIPFGFCHCGCGNHTRIAPQTRLKRGYLKGQPMLFISNHHKNNTKYKWLLNALATHNSNNCLLWPFARDTGGYGLLIFEGRQVLAHRLAFYVANGHWPKPYACHFVCDTRACINPRHLGEGTNQENQADMARKLRHGRRVKLTPESVAAIRRDYVRHSKTCNTFALGRKYGVSQSTIVYILKRRSWKYLP